MPVLSVKEKIGYAMGDAAANFVWRGALAYLAVFYTDTFGISAAAAAVLFLVVRLSDGITDIIMGMIADRTQTPWGKYRPWVLWSAPLLGLFMVLCFTTPNLSDNGKLIYAYITYLGLTLAYTINNVPYSALMGVMTTSDTERTNLSGYRLAGAFAGGLLVMGFLPDLVAYFGQGDDAKGYQWAMYVFASLLIVMMIITFISTQERVTTPQYKNQHLKTELWDLGKSLPTIILPLFAVSLFFYYRDWYSASFCIVVMLLLVLKSKKLVSKPNAQLTSTQQDIVDLIRNSPWLILLAMGFLTMMFNGIKYGVIAYYFKYYIADELLVGQYFVLLLVVSILGALSTSWLAEKIGKRALFITALMLSGLFTGALYWIPQDQVSWVFLLGGVAEFFAAMMPTLFFTMLGDAADYSEWKNQRRATGLTYAAGTFVQKTGSGFAGALVLVVLADYGYNGLEQSTIEGALPGMQLLMSWIPASFAFAGAFLMLFYPLNKTLMAQMSNELRLQRAL
ncbi:MFS transporter [Thalassotalea marina]|uniref:Major facilitator superfamily (MFS) profile domain-containing protein n=1 Tax=Thalassotalea marina TaxID=1673741 RepID=A0A919EN26_9GAMM|nr:MFS transporter [Thalassotalea marina]GHG00397.1 hypothetical protein GCM10017161_31330 [Thalassotalea marina]